MAYDISGGCEKYSCLKCHRTVTKVLAVECHERAKLSMALLTNFENKKMTNQPEDSKPTPKAMRAASRIEVNIRKIAYSGYTIIQSGQVRREVATIIDQETAVEHDLLKEKNAKLCIATGNYMMEVNRLKEVSAELLEACKNTVEELDALWGDYQNGRDIDISDVVASMLELPQAAITKAEEINNPSIQEIDKPGG